MCCNTLFISIFGTSEFWCRDKGHILETMHFSRPGFNFIYAGQKNSGWGHYSTDL